MKLSRVLPLTLSAVLAGCYSSERNFEKDRALVLEYGNDALRQIEHYDKENKISIYVYDGWPQSQAPPNNIRAVIINTIRDMEKIPGYKKEAKIGVFVGHSFKREGLEKMIENHVIGNELVLIGHSDGCKNVLEAVRTLDELNIPVKMVVYYDAFYTNTIIPGFESSDKIPRNVNKIVNFITESLFNGRELYASDCEDRKTAIVNIHTTHGHNDIDQEDISLKIAEEIVKSIEADQANQTDKQ